MKRNLILLLIISVIINLIFIGRHIYSDYFYHEPKPPHIPTNYRAELFNLLPIDNNEIIFAGDSHIERIELQEVFKNCLVKNRGVGGNTTQDLLDRLPEIINRHPKKVFFEIGINDILNEVDLSDIYKNIDLIIERTKVASPGSEIYFLSLLPTNWTSFKNKKPVINDVKLINQYLKKTPGITFIELYPVFSLNDRLDPVFDCGDHIHLSANAIIKECDILKPYVEK